ncbi:MAG: hypothetical protein LAN37_00280 [Acidobacteriia bacterium]|nr:hypothetical protein [Terriglobia bacterium]
MPELPKSVIERLRNRPGTQDHPDADLLAAFSEQALTGRERESVLAHLAICATCREAVALAQPGAPAEQPMTGFLPWYRQPQTLKWSGIAATVVVAAALVADYNLRRQVPPPSTIERRAETAAAVNAPAAAKAEPKAEMETKNGTIAADRVRAYDKLTAPSPKKQADAVMATRAVQPQSEAKTTKSEERRFAMGVPAAPPAEKALVKDDKLAVAERDQRADQAATQVSAPVTAPAPAATENAMLAKKQPASAAETVEVQAAAPAPAKSAGSVGGATFEGRAAAPALKAKVGRISTGSRWSISEKGQLQRSSDAGRTWQAVTVERGASFRAVAVVGADVWAGGPAALLYHSSDNGGNWTRQTLPGSAAAIVSLEFSDAQHGVARTADGAAWSTSDGGQHWTQQ